MEVVRSLKGLYTVRNLAFFSIFAVVFFVVSFLAPRVPVSCYPSAVPDFVVEVERDELDAALGKAATLRQKRKTLIIAVVNNAYVEAEGTDPAVNMLDLFLESFWVGRGTRPLINNLLIVATDRTAYERCLFKRLHCYLLANKVNSSELAGEKVFMSKGYINMTWTKVLFCLTVLQRGYDFIFTDADILWLRNPFKRLGKVPIDDIQFSTDEYFGNPRSEINKINTGFYFVRSNNKTISLFEMWYNMRDNLTTSNQPVLREMVEAGALKELNVTASFLETRFFSGFCQDSQDFDKVVTVHANCCRFISAKVKDLLHVLEDWKRFRGLPRKEASQVVWSSHDNCLSSWDGMNETATV